MSSVSAERGYRGFRIPCLMILAGFFSFLLMMLLARTDTNIVSIFNVYLGRSDAQSISIEQQFLLEAVIPNAAGSLLTLIFHDNHLIVGVWILTGYAILTASIVILLYEQSVDAKTIILCLLLSYILKILLSWIGKSDSYLIAFLVVATLSRYPVSRAVASGLAALCHPQISILALVFFQSERLAFSEKVQWSGLAGGIIGFGLDKVIVHSIVSTNIVSRSDYIANHIRDMLFGGLFDAASLLTVTLVPPLLVFLLSDVIKSSNINRYVRLRYVPFYVLLTAIFIISCFLTFDRSRVFVLATFPAYLFALRSYKEDIYAFLRGRTLISALIALLMLAMPQSDFTGWRGSSSVAKVVTRRLAPDVAARRFECAPGCDPISQGAP